MPEGPEIWRAADRLTEALAGRPAETIWFAFDELKPFEEKLKQSKIKNVEPRGKAILTRFANGFSIYSHNQLYGKWYLEAAGERPDTNRQLRLMIENDEYAALLYSASEIEVLQEEELEEHSYLQKLGPDLLHPKTGYEDVLGQYRDETFQNRKLTTLLLDQSFLSGVGNYLRSEILFDAGITIDKRPTDCTEDQLKQLAKSSLKMATRSYETGGITVEPKIVEALKREGKTRSEYRRYVYKRTDKRCFKCGTVIEEQTTGGRKIYYCPKCQGME